MMTSWTSWTAEELAAIAKFDEEDGFVLDSVGRLMERPRDPQCKPASSGEAGSVRGERGERAERGVSSDSD